MQNVRSIHSRCMLRYAQRTLPAESSPSMSIRTSWSLLQRNNEERDENNDEKERPMSARRGRERKANEWADTREVSESRKIKPRSYSVRKRYFAACVVQSWPSTHPLNIAWMSENTGSIGKRTIASGAVIGFANIYGSELEGIFIV